jgi:hypothetical protein
MEIEIVERLKQQLLQKGYDPETVEDKAVEFLRNSGLIHPDKVELTPIGEQRNQMTPEQRAIDRQVKRTGRLPSDYYYDHSTNRAKLRPHARRDVKGATSRKHQRPRKRRNKRLF